MSLGPPLQIRKESEQIIQGLKVILKKAVRASVTRGDASAAAADGVLVLC